MKLGLLPRLGNDSLQRETMEEAFQIPLSVELEQNGNLAKPIRRALTNVIHYRDSLTADAKRIHRFY